MNDSPLTCRKHIVFRHDTFYPHHTLHGELANDLILWCIGGPCFEPFDFVRGNVTAI